MASNSKEIRRRIKSTQSIKKITKAMELVSAAKMRRAQAAATASRPYATLSAELLRNVAGKTGQSNHPLLRQVISDKTKSTKILAIVVTSDKGLAGSLNSNTVNQTIGLLREWGRERFDLVTVGRKGTDALKRLGRNVIAVFPGKDKSITTADSRPIAEIAMEEFIKGTYEKVFIVYPQFISTLVQKPNIVQVLPFSTEADAKPQQEFLFEPSPQVVLENLVTRAVEFVIFQALVETAASEHSARMVAMKNANEAAGDLIDELSLSYNQARQAGITRELSEISAAKLAMEG
ncbi:MAG TPA: ATP synthase F1 subunit gamma [Methylomirabilota bacterium]|nr:ATP synthase F1 subunit gamma [Methylomirabilota bacterium]